MIDYRDYRRFRDGTIETRAQKYRRVIKCLEGALKKQRRLQKKRMEEYSDYRKIINKGKTMPYAIRNTILFFEVVKEEKTLADASAKAKISPERARQIIFKQAKLRAPKFFLDEENPTLKELQKNKDIFLYGDI